MPRLRPHLTTGTGTGTGTPPSTKLPVDPRLIPAFRSAQTAPYGSAPSSRDVSLEITDTQADRIAPICYGRFQATFKLVHFDITGTSPNYYIEMIALIGEGPIDGVEYIWVDEQQVYPSPPAWANVQIRQGGTFISNPSPGHWVTDQTVVTNITNATIAAMTHPGQAYVSIKLTLSSAKLNGGIPQVKIQGRGLVLWDWRPFDVTPAAFSEDPILALYDAMTNPEYGAGFASGYAGLCDIDNVTPGSFAKAANDCESLLTYDSLAWVGQTNSDVQDNCSTAHHLQSFKVPSSTFAFRVKIRALATDTLNLGIKFRLTPTGADITPDWLSGNGVAMTIGQDYIAAAGLQTTGHGIVAGQTMYAVWQTTEYHASSHAWHRNSLTDAYANGQAQVWSGGAWVSSNYDFWFQAFTIEQKARCEYIVSERQPIEDIAKVLLQVCNGRLGMWDGLYRVALDGLAANTGTLSDLQSPTPDIPIVQDTFAGSRADGNVPNTAIATYLDVEDWQRKEVKIETLAVQQGLQQPRELRIPGLVAVPSGGQLFRLLQTWLKRGQRTWLGSCQIPQHGLKLAPADLRTLTSRLFSGSKVVLVDGITDGPGGNFNLSLLEYDPSDFSISPYVPQTIIVTTTVV